MHRHELAVMAHRLPLAQKFVLLTIASHADESGRGARPSVSTTVATLLELSPRQAKRHVAWLRAEGFLLETGRYPVPGGREVVEYSVALDQETRMAWRTGVISDTRVTSDTRPNYQTNYQTQTRELLRSSLHACGAEEGITVPAPGFEPEAPAEKPRWTLQQRDGDDAQALGDLGEPDAHPGPQKGAQRRRASTAGQRLAERWRERRVQHDWKILENHRQCITDFNRHLAKTGVSEETLAAMIDAWWADPGLVSRLDPARTAHTAFLYRDWKTVLARVERAAPVDPAAYIHVPTEREKRNRRLLGLDD